MGSWKGAGEVAASAPASFLSSFLSAQTHALPFSMSAPLFFQAHVPVHSLSPSLLLTQAEASCGGHIPPYPGADSWRSSRSSSSSELPGPSSCFSAGTLTGPWTVQGSRTAEQQVSGWQGPHGSVGDVAAAGVLTGSLGYAGQQGGAAAGECVAGARRLWAVRRVQGCARVLGLCIGTGRGSSR